METISCDRGIRLRNLIETDLEIAKKWYSDPVVLNGVISPAQTEPLSYEYLVAMYKDLRSRGDLYVIEVFHNENWCAIGDVTLTQNGLPIVIGDSKYRGKKIAKKVIQVLILQARGRGWEKITLKGIYKNNISSQHLFESCGFKRIGENTKCWIYELML